MSNRSLTDISHELKDVLRVMGEVNDAILNDWFLDAEYAEGITQQDPIVDLDRDDARERWDKELRPFFDILNLSREHGALWTTVSIKNQATGNIVYYVVPLTNAREDKNWERFARYRYSRSRASLHYRSNLIDLERLVIGKSTRKPIPLLISRCTDGENIPPEVEDAPKLLDASRVIEVFESNRALWAKKKPTSLIDSCSRLLSPPSPELVSVWHEVRNHWATQRSGLDVRNSRHATRFGNLLFTLWAQNSDWKYYLFLPGVASRGDDLNTVGTVAVAFDRLPSPYIYAALVQVTTRIMAEWARAYADVIRLQVSQRSAVAAIMGRNMSHNIGSHVLARLATQESTLKSLFQNGRQMGRSGPPSAIPYARVEAAAIEAARLNAFLRMRMDFVADISTAQKPPDPTRMSLIGELIVPFLEQNLLWGNLCASHNIAARDIAIRIQVGTDARRMSTMTFTTGKLPKLDDLAPQLAFATISVPNGSIGCQALYSIVENLVRNAVKHGRRPSSVRAEDFRDLDDFIEKLREPRRFPNEEPVSELILSRMSAEVRDLLIQVPALPTEVLAPAVLADLNRVMQEAPLYDEATEICFRRSNLSSDLLSLCREAKVSNEWLFGNRLLLESVFQNDLIPLVITMQLHTRGNHADNSDLYRVLLFDSWQSCSNQPQLVSSINEKVREHLTKEDGSLVASNRGLKEIKAAAAYLRGLQPEDVDDEGIRPPLLMACESDGNLAYQIYMRRPRDVFVYAPQLDLPTAVVMSLDEQGIEVTDSAFNFRERSSQYSLAVIFESPDIVSDLEASFPLRTLVIDSQGSVVARCGTWEATCNRIDEVRQFHAALVESRASAATALAWKLWTAALSQAPGNPMIWIHEAQSQKRERWNFSSRCRLIDDDTSPPANRNVLLFSRHGHRHGDDDAVLYYEPYQYGIDAISFVLDNAPEQHDSRSTIVSHLQEAGLVQVLVIDERVQEAAHNVSRTYLGAEGQPVTRTLAEWLGHMGIHIPPLGGPDALNLESHQLSQERINDWIRSKVSARGDAAPTSSSAVPYLLVVHQGILDVVGLQSAEEAEKWIVRLTQRSPTRRGGRTERRSVGVAAVIVTSGRGNPDNIAPNARFVPLSTVMSYTTERKSKLHLVQSLFASRRSSKL